MPQAVVAQVVAERSLGQEQVRIDKAGDAEVSIRSGERRA
jgi:hypothetical protein